MISTVERTAYELAQTIRLGWYGGQSTLSTRWSARKPAPPELAAKMPSRAALLASRDRLIDREIANLEAGYYRMPRRLVGNPLASLRRSLLYFADLGRVNERLRAGTDTALAPPDGRRYPAYYLRAFHHQTDGYLSARSAALYDHQVEVLFGGVGDVMRRQALVPLYDYIAEGRRIADLSLIDIACGTGGFLAEVKHNYPRLRVTGLDISPYYLAEARRRLAPWSRVTLIEAAAEEADLAPASFDVATCIYLFHELPREVHGAVARSIARLLRPGGVCVFLDSLQLGDVPEFDALLRYFPIAFHEPFYADYLEQDLEAVFRAAGLEPLSCELAHFSRVMTLKKRLPVERPLRGILRGPTSGPIGHGTRIDG
jgi:ubiquinone/menaquinone biosynthesis C-methylase UbiE